MPREALVDESVVGTQEIGDTAVLVQVARQEEFRLPLEGLQQALVVVGIADGIDHHLFDAPQIQPCAAKLSTKAAIARGSASMRRTSRSRFPALLSWPLSASDSRRSSGMLLHMKKESLDATSRSVGPRWTRSRKSGSTSMRSSANWMPASKLPPSRRPESKKSTSVCTSAFFTGRRYARRASLETIFVAQSRSSAAARGWQVKIARRLGYPWPAPLPYGTADQNRPHIRVVHVHLVVRDDAPSLQRLR